MAITVQINGIDRSDYIDWKTLKIQNVLTNRVDRCTFNLNNYGDKTYHPINSGEVVIYNGATKIFGGVIISIQETSEAYKILQYKIEAVDYARLLDGKLVSTEYENQTVNDIIADLFDKYAPAGFTYNNVNCSDIISYIQFNYQPMSQCFRELAELTNYDWYVDYDKDLHFFAKESNTAPFDLNDDDGSYIFDSLDLRKDNTQIRNVVIVRGGEYLADTLTVNIQTNGIDRVYNLPYKYEYNTLNATLSATNLSIGIDFSADPDDYDVLFNKNEKVLKWKETDLPSSSAVLTIIGQPYLPVIVKQYNRESIQSMVSAEGGDGEYEYLIVDNTINTKEGARERAAAELYAYAATAKEGYFDTYTAGLISGQRIRVNSAVRGVDEYYVINKVTTIMRTPEQPKYQVSLMTTRTFGMIDMLRKLMQNKTKDVDTRKKEILDLIEGAIEEITFVEAPIATSKEHNPIAESVTPSESLTAQSIDYDVDFVLGPYTWGGEGSGDNDRQFNLDGSILE